jgi:pilus assembly protein CpaF
MTAVVSDLAPGLVDEVRAHLAATGEPCTPQAVASALRASGRPVGQATVLAVHDVLRSDSVGAGPLDPLLALPGITDVLVNGPDLVWFDRGRGLERSAITFPDDDAVRRLAQRLAAAGGRRLDDASPCVDVRLPDGTRCHAVLAPLARPGTSISLRVPHRLGLDLAALLRLGTLTESARIVVDRLLEARLAYLVSGGTGSGKTTLLGALLSAVPREERVVVVEDSAELRPDHPHVVSLEARPPNIEDAGRVTLRALVREALRMRPDRLVVGEVRGAEVVDLLAALNTGHEGGCGTIHANSPADVPARIEALALPAGLGRAAVHAQLASALGCVLHVARDRDGVRRLVEIGVPVRGRGGYVDVVPAVRYVEGVTRAGPGADRLAELLERC